MHQFHPLPDCPLLRRHSSSVLPLGLRSFSLSPAEKETSPSLSSTSCPAARLELVTVFTMASQHTRVACVLCLHVCRMFPASSVVCLHASACVLVWSALLLPVASLAIVTQARRRCLPALSSCPCCPPYRVWPFAAGARRQQGQPQLYLSTCPASDSSSGTIVGPVSGACPVHRPSASNFRLSPAGHAAVQCKATRHAPYVPQRLVG